MYELTSLLTTMSAGSASFVAILGGLIAQKVIEINNGRAAIEEEIKELNEQKEFQQKEIDKYDSWIEEDDAIEFIGKRAEALLHEKTFEEALDAEEPNGDEDVKKLHWYWDKALRILQMYASKNGKPHFEIVREIIETFEEVSPPDGEELSLSTDEDFIKGVCEIIGDHFEAYYKNDGHNSIGQLYVTPSLLNPTQYGVSLLEYNSWSDSRNRADVELSAIELHVKQLEDRKRRLIVPDELKNGFWLFGAFILCCVLLPLILTPFMTESYIVFVIVKVLFLSIYGAGLLSVLLYIKRLLPKRTRQDKEKCRE